MVAPDYQEFANWAVARSAWHYRDLRHGMRIIGQNRRNVARLPRWKWWTKAELARLGA